MTQDQRTTDILEAIRKLPAGEKKVLYQVWNGGRFETRMSLETLTTDDLHYLRDRLIEAMENYVDPLSIEKAEARCRELENQP